MREVRPDLVHPGIVGRLEPDQEPGVVVGRVQVTQDLRQLGDAELASAAAAVRIGRKTYLVRGAHPSISSQTSPGSASILAENPKIGFRAASALPINVMRGSTVLAGPSGRSIHRTWERSWTSTKKRAGHS